MNVSLEDVLNHIETADDYEINEIIDAVRKRFSVAFPDWDVFYLACPKNDPAQRQQTLETILNYLKTQK